MANRSDYCISAGRFARLCNTTRDTLRYYQEQGILVPRKDEVNGYHYYSHAQVSSFYFITTLRRIGCSVSDIKTYLLAGEKARFDSFMDRQYVQLLSQQKELEEKIATVTNTRKLLDEIRAADIGHPCLRPMLRDVALFLTPVCGPAMDDTGEMVADIRRHLELCRGRGIQAFPVGISLAQKPFLAASYQYRELFSFVHGTEHKPDARPLAGTRLAVMVCRESDGQIASVYRVFADFLQRENLILRTDIYNLSIVNVIDPQDTHRYLKFLFVGVD